ncbi:hypothetical protein ECANGB1_2324 [Enterospora canceri]|uniref:Uncharacterized protein n=1 Tax=Enterospora canceri TaxID=1081671 RepID=A0A1Y1S8M7_9MICR|nr:hypothetical protein ECANGB1_2324 [Enterospora canceri]
MKTLIGFVFLLVHYCAYDLEIRLDYSIDDLYITCNTPGTIVRLMDERRVLGFDEFVEDNFPNALVSSFANRYAINIFNDYQIASVFSIRDYFDQNQNDIKRLHRYIETNKTKVHLFGSILNYRIVSDYRQKSYETLVNNGMLAAKVQLDRTRLNYILIEAVTRIGSDIYLLELDDGIGSYLHTPCYVIKHNTTLNHSIKIWNNTTPFNGIEISKVNSISGQKINLDEYDSMVAHNFHVLATGLIAATKIMEINALQMFVNITVDVESYTIKRMILDVLRLNRLELNNYLDFGYIHKFLDRLIDMTIMGIAKERKVVKQLLLKLFTPCEIIMFLRSSQSDTQNYVDWWNVKHTNINMSKYNAELSLLCMEMDVMRMKQPSEREILIGFRRVFKKKLNLDKLNYSCVVENEGRQSIPLYDDSIKIVEDNNRKRTMIYCAIGFTLIAVYVFIVLLYNILMSRKKNNKNKP